MKKHTCFVLVQPQDANTLRLTRYVGRQRSQVADMTLFHETTSQEMRNVIEDFRLHGMEDEPTPA